MVEGVSTLLPDHGRSELTKRFRYAGAEEIWKFYKGEAEKCGVYKHTKFGHRVISAVWSDTDAKWTVTVEDLATGHISEDRAEVVLNCAGVLK